jgi:hypothetical protein
MKLTKEQLSYDIFDHGVDINFIWTHLVPNESIRVLEYPSHIERRRVTMISLSDDILFFELQKQLKKIIVPSGCYLINCLPSYLNVTIEYK